MPYKDYSKDLAHAREYYRKNRNRILSRLAKANHRLTNHRRVYHRQWTKVHFVEIKKEVMRVYGNGTCACCGESNIKFLSLDHVKGNGNKHRKRRNNHGGVIFYCWLKRHNWPKRPRLQVLCYNCNLGRSFNTHNPGVCPHKE
jgi:hypothetical protein